MYDTLILKLYKSSVPDTDFLEETSSYIDISNSGMYISGISWISGYLKGLRIHITDSSIKITGSIAKYYLGTNLETLNRNDVKKAIEDLSNRLHLPIDKAVLSRIDIAENYIMEHKVSSYIEKLGELSRFNRLEMAKASLYYKQKGKSQELCIYDKIAEAKTDKVEIPERFIDKNVLRYEYRLLKRLNKRLNIREATVSLLYDEDFYSKLITLWADMFLSIKPINKMVPNLIKGKEVISDKNLGILTKIKKAGGEIAYRQWIKEQQKEGELTKKQASDRKRAIDQAIKVGGNPFMVPCKRYQELKHKIECTNRLIN